MVENSPANAGEIGSIPGSGRSPGGRNTRTPQYSCLASRIDRGATVHEVAKKRQTRLSD